MDACYVEQNGPQTLAYVGSGVRMVILDVTDPANVVELGDALLPAIVRGIEVRGGHAFIALGWPAAFAVVDVSDPASPVVVSASNASSYGSHMDVQFRGNEAFCRGACREVDRYDVTDPENPLFMGLFENLGTDNYLISGDFMYIAIIDYGLAGHVAVLDLRLPHTSPEYSQMVGITGYIAELDEVGDRCSVELALSGDYLYVTGNQFSPHMSRIFVVDVSDPEAPAHVGTWGNGPGEDLEFSVDAAVSDGRLYVVDWKNDGGWDPTPHRALAIFDIATDPTSPALLGEYWSVGAATSVTVVGTTAYLCDEREGLLILDCGDPGDVTRQGSYHSPAVFHQGLLDGDTFYVTDRRYGVTALDVSDPLHPQLLGRHETGKTQNWGLAKRADSLYVAAGFAGLQVLDVADPAAPSLLGDVPFAGPRAGGLELYDDDVYGLIAVTGTSPGAYLVCFAVDDPQNIIEVGSVLIGGGSALPRSIAISNTQDGIAHVANSSASVTADVSDPADPFVISQDQWRRQGVCLEGDVLYVAANPNIPNKGMYTFDVRDPYAQTQLSFHHTQYQDGYTVAVQSQRAYLGSEGGDLRVFDVSDPAAPSLLLHHENNPHGHLFDLVVDGPIVYAVTSHGNGDFGPGVLTYLVYEPGDLNSDLVVDTADVEAFVDVLVGSDPDPVHAVIADMDGDGNADGADIPLFVAAILNN